MTSTTRSVQTSDGHRLAYDRQGEGPALVTIPGITTDRAWWHRAGYVDALAESFTVLNLDPLGHGESDRPHDPGAYSNDSLVDHVAAVLDAEGVDRFRLWGYSRGGLIGSLFAWSFPERVEVLILGGTLIDLESGNAWIDNAASDALMQGDWDPYWAQFPAPVTPEVRGFIEGENDPKAIGAILKGRSPINWRQIECPVFGYYGDGEAFLRTAMRGARSLGIPAAVLPTGGHAETFMAIEPSLSLVRPFLGPVDVS